MDSVIFALSADVAPQRDDQLIIICPSGDRWNDFGFRIRVDIFVPDIYSPRSPLRLQGFLGFSENKRTQPDVRMLVERLNTSPQQWLDSSEFPSFFTMLPEIGLYRELVSRFGPKDATSLLNRAHDMVAATQKAGNGSWFREAQESSLFRKAFLRTSEAFFAWTNAGVLLQGLEFEEVGRISKTFNIGFQLEGRPNEHKLSFDFDVNDKVLPKRFAVVIGKNGVGKSQTLGRIARAALDGDGSLTDGDGGRPSLNRLLAFASTSTSSSAFPPDRRQNPKVWYRRFTLNASTGSRWASTTANMIVSLARSNEQIQTIDRLGIFLQAISAIDDWRELGLQTFPEYGNIVPIESLSQGGEMERLDRLSTIDLARSPLRLINGRAFSLSSGEEAFLRFAAIASLYIENSTLVLLDEPETHLHPNFISQFVAVLDNILEQTGSAAIIATHSVYFVREAFEDQVIVLRSGEDRAILPEKPTLKTFGADVGSISYFVFGEDQPSRLASKVETRITTSSKTWTETFEDYKDELSLKLLGEIRSRIEPPKAARDQ